MSRLFIAMLAAMLLTGCGGKPDKKKPNEGDSVTPVLPKPRPALEDCLLQPEGATLGAKKYDVPTGAATGPASTKSVDQRFLFNGAPKGGIGVWVFKSAEEAEAAYKAQFVGADGWRPLPGVGEKADLSSNSEIFKGKTTIDHRRASVMFRRGPVMVGIMFTFTDEEAAVVKYAKAVDAKLVEYLAAPQ